MLLSAVSVFFIVLQSPEIPEGPMNNPVYCLNHCLYRKLQYHVDDSTNHNALAEQLYDLTNLTSVLQSCWR
jgi:hypothetical protein